MAGRGKRALGELGTEEERGLWEEGRVEERRPEGAKRLLSCVDSGWLVAHPEFEAQFWIALEWERQQRKAARGEDRAHMYAPGSGPVGQSCGTCAKCVRRPHGGRRTYHKCSVMREYWTRGRSTDIRLRDPACLAWEAAVEVIRFGGTRRCASGVVAGRFVRHPFWSGPASAEGEVRRGRSPSRGA